jgi:hypothetical protein
MKINNALILIVMLSSCNSNYQDQKDINPIVVAKIKEHIKYIQDEATKKEQVKILICVHEKVFRDTSFITVEYINKKYILDAILKEFRPAWKIVSDSLAIIGFENKSITIQKSKKDNFNLYNFIPIENQEKYLSNEYYPIELIFVKEKFIKTRVSDDQLNPFWQAFRYHNPPPVKVF